MARVVIVGGYGVFGSLTARLLVRDGHELWLAGRNPEKGEALASEIGAELLQVDVREDPEALFGLDPDVVIDAAGPFQDYGVDPYRVPRLCIEWGCHYLDLSDGSEFTRGIAALDAEAEAAGVFALSGASSVPGLSSVVVEDLARGFDEIDEVDIAILPGNRAPRGMSVIKSVLSGVGRPSPVLRDGAWRDVVGWTERKRYRLAPDLVRSGYFVDVPDIQLLPERVAARSVMFRAGLELGVMNGALAVLARLRQLWWFELPEVAFSALHMLSKLLLPFGTDRGGMQVNVSGLRGGNFRHKRWTLVAEQGDGPFVPGIMCRAILRDPSEIRPGARPCLAELRRREVEAAMSDLAITTEVEHVDVSEGAADMRAVPQ
ncbi:MAG: saccharopine dehydrogenase NADP-binding domain-containing protein [Pseudomonadota bacterium]